MTLLRAAKRCVQITHPTGKVCLQISLMMNAQFIISTLSFLLHLRAQKSTARQMCVRFQWKTI